MRGRAQKRRLRGGDVRAKMTFIKMTAEVPEIELVNRKNTLMTRHCVGQTFVYCRKATPLQQKSNLYTLFSAGVKEKKQAEEFLFCF